MGTESDTYRHAAEILTRGESHRVWSLIVTIFGDLAQAEGERISGSALTRLVGLMGVKPEAMRVALHRLRKDGWIESLRAGRGSLHELTPYGRAQSAEASPRIYDRVRSYPDRWHLLLAGTGEMSGRAQLEAALLTGDYLSIGPQAAMGPGPMPGDTGALMAVETDRWACPDWVRAQVCPPPVLAQYDALHRDFTRLVAMLDADATGLSVPEAAALRLLVVHCWRRLLLRHPDLPAGFFPDGWPGSKCRGLFCSLMARLPSPTLDRLESSLTDPDSVSAALS